MDEPCPPECVDEQWRDPADLTIDDLASIAKGLAHPARIGILQQFYARKPHIAREIVGECDLAQSTVSEHLRILREADLLSATKDGPRTWYCLRRAVLRQFAGAVEMIAGDSILVSDSEGA